MESRAERLGKTRLLSGKMEEKKNHATLGAVQIVHWLPDCNLDGFFTFFSFLTSSTKFELDIGIFRSYSLSLESGLIRSVSNPKQPNRIK